MSRGAPHALKPPADFKRPGLVPPSRMHAPNETAHLYFRECEVWRTLLGKGIGYETDGKSREFTRIVITGNSVPHSFLLLEK
jgi:hypothetical protein